MKGIIFSTPMVLAMLSGKKDITRRPMNPQPHRFAVSWWTWKGHLQEDWAKFAPYKVGEMVYMKESWRPIAWFSGTDTVLVNYKAGGHDESYCTRLQYEKAIGSRFFDWDWYPSMFMPAWASRLLQKVLLVRAEQLQEIIESEAIKEGMKFAFPQWESKSAIEIYSLYWDVLYGAGSWASNPWLFRYGMEKVKQ